MFPGNRRYRVPKEPRLVDDLDLVLGAEPSSAGNGRDDLNTLLTSRITHTEL